MLSDCYYSPGFISFANWSPALKEMELSVNAEAKSNLVIRIYYLKRKKSPRERKKSRSRDTFERPKQIKENEWQDRPHEAYNWSNRDPYSLKAIQLCFDCKIWWCRCGEKLMWDCRRLLFNDQFSFMVIFIGQYLYNQETKAYLFIVLQKDNLWQFSGLVLKTPRMTIEKLNCEHLHDNYFLLLHFFLLAYGSSFLPTLHWKGDSSKMNHLFGRWEWAGWTGWECL